MTLDLFAGIAVSDFQQALDWYRRLLGSAPAFFPNSVEAVWQVEEHGFLYVAELPERAGHAIHTLFVDDLDARLHDIGTRGIEPARQERYDNAVRKVTYLDPDGNEVAFAGAATD